MTYWKKYYSYGYYKIYNHVRSCRLHIVYSLANRQGLFAYVRTCKTGLDTTTKFMVVVKSLFNIVISSFPDNMFYHAWTWLLIYHDGSNNVVQVCSFIKPRAVCSNMHEQACQQHCSKQHRVSKTVGSHLKRILANLPNEVVLQIRYPFLGPIGSDSSTIDTGIISHHFVHPTEQPFHAWATVLASNFSQDVIRRAELTSGVTRITTLSGVNVA